MDYSKLSEAQVRLQALRDEIAAKNEPSPKEVSEWLAEVISWQGKLSNQGDLVNDHPHMKELHQLRNQLLTMQQSLQRQHNLGNLRSKAAAK